jgi:hypothetical protein
MTFSVIPYLQEMSEIDLFSSDLAFYILETIQSGHFQKWLKDQLVGFWIV